MAFLTSSREMGSAIDLAWCWLQGAASVSEPLLGPFNHSRRAGSAKGLFQRESQSWRGFCFSSGGSRSGWRIFLLDGWASWLVLANLRRAFLPLVDWSSLQRVIAFSFLIVFACSRCFRSMSRRSSSRALLLERAVLIRDGDVFRLR